MMAGVARGEHSVQTANISDKTVSDSITTFRRKVSCVCLDKVNRSGQSAA